MERQLFERAMKYGESNKATGVVLVASTVQLIGASFYRHSFIFIFTFIFTFVISSCKEEKDTTSPILTISAPMEGLDLFLPDSVIVSGTVSDDNEVGSVSISLLDQDLIPTSVKRTVSIGATSGQFNAQLLIDDVEIGSGTHYIQVSADDGVNVSKEFVEVDVHEVPRTYLGLVLVIESGAGSDYILLAPNGSQSVLHSADDTHRMMDIDPVSGRVYHITSEQAALQVIDVVESENVILSAPIGATSGAFYNDLIYDRENKEVLVSLHTGQIIRYNRNGDPLGMLGLGMLTEVFQLGVHGDLILAETRSSGGDNKRIRHYDRFSFAPQGEEVLPMDLVEILDIGGDHRLLIGQQGDVRKILIYDISDTEYEERSVNGSTAPLDVCAQGENALLAYDDVFYRFITTSEQLIPFSVPTVQAVAYDEVNGVAYLASGAMITAYGITTWTMLDSWTVAGCVQDMQPLYNK